MEANGLMWKQQHLKALKKEYELPNEDLDEVVYNISIWQSPSERHVDVPLFSEELVDDQFMLNSSQKAFAVNSKAF